MILALATFLCSLQTMPNTGAAGFLQPGTGHSCFFRAGAGTEDGVKCSVAAGCFGGRPGPRFWGAPKALARAAWIRWATAASTVARSWLVKASIRAAMFGSVLGIDSPVCLGDGQTYGANGKRATRLKPLSPVSVAYLPRPICFINSWLSQNRYSSSITPFFQ